MGELNNCKNCNGTGVVPVYTSEVKSDICPFCTQNPNIDVEFPVETVDRIQKKFWTLKERILESLDNFEKEILTSQQVLRSQREAYLDGLTKEQGE